MFRHCFAVLVTAFYLPAIAQIAPTSAPETALASPEPATRDTTALEKVEIVSPSGENEQRRASTASKIVIKKDEIERFGDNSISEVLKRLPGVTSGGRPGHGGDIRMRGMGGGYTQILVNGERTSPGFSLDSLAPDQVDRIEILRAPTAEYGAQAVAGTINIVLKDTPKKTRDELKLGVDLEDNRASPNASWTHNDKVGDKINYALTLSLNHGENRDENDTRTRWYDRSTGNLVLDRREVGFTKVKFNRVNLNGRLQVALGEGESVLFTPFIVASKSAITSESQLDQMPGGAIPPPYAKFADEGAGRFAMLRTNTQWQKTLGDGKKIEIRYGVGIVNGSYESHSLRQSYGTTSPRTRAVDDTTFNNERSWNLAGKFSQQLQNEHSIVGGLELDSSKRRNSRTTLESGVPILTEFGDDVHAAVLRVATYAQDEWNPTKQISAYAGLRWEGIETRSDSDAYQAINQSSVLSPLLHATWKPNEKSRDQFRSSLTRSYKAATTGQLIARPAISQLFPAGTNQPDSPDQAGNPNLAPELARGFEIAYEHYLSKGGLVSANYFYRRINDLIRNVMALEDVSWSAEKRWVTRPQNIGNATVQGIELEAKFRLDELWSAALPVSLRTNVSFFDSNVEQVPRPNNRLEGQPRGTANVGADHKLRGLPISMGASVNYTPAYDLQLSDIQSNTMSAKVVTDAFVVWFINKNAQLRMSANNLLPREYLNTSSILSGTLRQDNDNANPSKVRWGMRLELKL